MKLIDGDNLISRFEKASEIVGSDLFPVPYIKQCVIEMPAIEPAEIAKQYIEFQRDEISRTIGYRLVEMDEKHGEWVHNENYESWSEKYICSVCHRNALSDGDYRHTLSNYCPNCGAKMDLEAADETSAPGLQFGS